MNISPEETHQSDFRLYKARRLAMKNVIVSLCIMLALIGYPVCVCSTLKAGSLVTTSWVPA